MKISAQLIESLLFEEEGNALDFKSDQYAFKNGTDEQKGELLKDILALANAFRRTDAFILVGVREVKGGRSVVLGVSEQLEDAHVQQFVNGKTQRPVTFAYRAAQHDGLPIGIIHIPKQPRPLYATRAFGRVQKGVVYLRRGSSTAPATPEEIAQMGVADQIDQGLVEPELQLHLADPITHQDLGVAASLDIVLLDTPAPTTIPDYAESSGGVSLPDYMTGVQPDYWRQLVKFTRSSARHRPIRLAVHNKGTTTAHDVRLVFDVVDPKRTYGFVTESDRPAVPVRRRNPAWLPEGAMHSFNKDIQVSRRGDSCHVECLFGKLQPKETNVLGNDLYVGANNSGELQLKCQLFADNLAQPTSQTITIAFNVSQRSVTLKEIQEIEDMRLTKLFETSRSRHT